MCQSITWFVKCCWLDLLFFSLLLVGYSLLTQRFYGLFVIVSEDYCKLEIDIEHFLTLVHDCVLILILCLGFLWNVFNGIFKDLNIFPVKL